MTPGVTVFPFAKSCFYKLVLVHYCLNFNGTVFLYNIWGKYVTKCIVTVVNN